MGPGQRGAERDLSSQQHSQDSHSLSHALSATYQHLLCVRHPTKGPGGHHIMPGGRLGRGDTFPLAKDTALARASSRVCADAGADPSQARALGGLLVPEGLGTAPLSW